MSSLFNHEAAQVCLEFLTSHFKGCQHISIQKIEIEEFNGTAEEKDKVSCHALISLQVRVHVSKGNPKTEALYKESAANHLAASSVLAALSPIACECSSKTKNFS